MVGPGAAIGFAEARCGSEDHAASTGEATAAGAVGGDEIEEIVGGEGAGIEGALVALGLRRSGEVA